MAVKLADVFVNVSARTDDLDRGLGRAKKSVGAFGNVLTGVLQGVGQAAFRGLTNALGNAVRGIGSTINAASDLSESINKTSVVFGDSAQEILEWSKTSATAMGQSQQAALEATATFGNLFTSMGVGRKDAANLSKEMVQLASDLASFNNVSPEEALTALRSGIVGEIEPLRRFGVSLSAAAVEAKAMEMGLAASSKELTEQDKILARYELILQQTANAQGDFARTSSGLANQQRIFAANLRDGAAAVGQAFAPAATAFLRGLNTLMREVAPYGIKIMDSFAAGLARGIIAITPVLVRLRQLFTYWLKPGSPPRLLPALDKWGTEAMNAYLQGWTNADLSIFDELSSSLESVIRSFAGAGAIGEGDLVTRVFGTRDAITRAISEFQRAGSVSESTLRAIVRAAGPAGESVRGLVSSYFDLQTASRAAAAAQEELTAVTERYDAALEPINDKLRAVQNQQADIRDQQRAAQLNAEIADATTTASDRRLAQLELEEIGLRRQQRLIEDERDIAIDGAQDKLDAARKEEQAKQNAYDAQASLMQQQVDANRLIEEERNLRQRLADEALAAQETALRQLEAAQKEMEQADAQRRAELERIYQATLDYNLAIADTPGKIALLKLELGRYAEGSAEYYGILTQIAGLEQSLAAEREAAAGAGGGAGMFGGLEDAIGEGGILTETTAGVALLTTALDDMFKKMEESPPLPEGFWTDWADEIVNLTDAIVDFTGLFTSETQEIEDVSSESGKRLTRQQQIDQALRLSELRTWVALFRGDWVGFWGELKLQSDLGFEKQRLAFGDGFGGMNRAMANKLAEISLAMGTWLADAAQSIVDWGENLYTAGHNAIGNLWDGMTAYWNEVVVPGWTGFTQWLRDMLPGSEPKIAGSPLRNLGDAGAAIVDNIMAGMNAASFNLAPVAAPMSAAAAGAVTNVYFDQVFQTQPDFGLARQASREGVLSAMRARGA